MTFIHGLDELVPDTDAGKRASSRRREEKRAAGEASRARSAETLEQRQKAYAARSTKAKGWRAGNAVVINPVSLVGAPTGSWWLGVPADQFAQAAAAEQPRMQGSKLGRGHSEPNENAL